MGSPGAACLLLLSALLGCCGRTGAVPGALRVATCSQTYSPFVMLTADGSFYGFEVAQWAMIYELLINRAARSGDPDLIAWVGDEMPPLIPYEIYRPEDGVALVDSGEVDVAFCGYYRTPDRAQIVDLSPRTKSSGYAIVVSANPNAISTKRLIASTFPMPGPVAVFALLVLLCLSVIYAHAMWLVERSTNADISEGYGAGVFDTWWMSIVIATSVGYGDKVPRTLAGRLLTVTWIFTTIYCLAIFAASMTSDLIFKQVASDTYTSPIQAPTDLAGLRVGAYFMKAQETMSRVAPNVDPLDMYPTNDDVYWQLLNGNVDAIVDDFVVAQYMVGLEAYKGNLMLTGDLFNPIDYGLLIARPNGTTHPIYSELIRAVYDYDQGVYKLRREANEKRWLADQSAQYLLAGEQQVLYDSVMDVNGRFFGGFTATFIVAILVGFYHYKALRRKLHERKLLLRQLGCAKRQDRYLIRKGADRLFDLWDIDQDERLSISEIIYGLKKMGFREEGLEAQILMEAQTAGTHLHLVDGQVQVTREDFQWIIRLLVYEGFTGDNTEAASAAKSANAADVMTLLDDFMILSRDIRKRMQLMEWRLASDPTLPPPPPSVPATPELFHDRSVERGQVPKTSSPNKSVSKNFVPPLGAPSGGGNAHSYFPGPPPFLQNFSFRKNTGRPNEEDSDIGFRNGLQGRHSGQAGAGLSQGEAPRAAQPGGRAAAAVKGSLRNFFR